MLNKSVSEEAAYFVFNAWHSAVEIILGLKSKGWIASGVGRVLLGRELSLT